MSAQVESFSGTHPYRSECVRGIVELDASLNEVPDATMLADAMVGYIDGALEHGRCPRCGGPLLPEDHPDGWLPAGSRETLCRCIPICGVCGSDEALADHVSLLDWPVPANEVQRRHEELMAQFELVTLSPKIARSIKPGRPTGGWAEFGVDEPR